MRIEAAQVSYPEAPSVDASEERWLRWANAWPTLVALGISCVRLTEREACFEIAVNPFVPNPNGAVNGGIVAAFADQAMGVLTMRTCPAGSVPATCSLHVQYHRPVRAPFEMVATALPGGRRIRYIEVIVVDAEGVRAISAQGTMAVNGPIDGPGRVQ